MIGHMNLESNYISSGLFSISYNFSSEVSMPDQADSQKFIMGVESKNIGNKVETAMYLKLHIDEEEDTYGVTRLSLSSSDFSKNTFG